MGWLKKLTGFENHFTKGISKDIFKNPTRMLTGIDPLSTGLWNKALGRDDRALVNYFGSPGQQYYDSARAEGIDTGPAEKFHDVADVVAGVAGGAGAMNGLGNLAAGAGNAMGVGGGAAATGGTAAATGGASAAGVGGAAAAGGGGLLSSLGGVQGLVSAGTGILSYMDAKKQKEAAAEAAKYGGVPEYMQPYVMDAVKRAQGMADKPYEAYGGELIPGQNRFEQWGQDDMTNWANGTPQMDMADQAYQGMVNNPRQFDTQAHQVGQQLADWRSVDPTSAAYERANAQGMNASLGSFQGAGNSYLGAQSNGIAGVGSIGGQQGANPYLGQSIGQIGGTRDVQAGRNPMLGMDNPYLTQSIDQAQGDLARNYDRAVRPQQDARMAMSGSFGNTGLMEQESEDRRNLQDQMGRISTGMRMQDYGAQQQLQESAVGRDLGAQQFNAGNDLNTQQFNAGLRGSDLGRNLGGMFQQSGMGLDAAKFDAGNQLGVQQFNAGMGQADLARNAGMAQQMGQFNAGQANDMSRFNAGLLTGADQYNAGAGNQMAQFNAQNFGQNSQFNANQLAGARATNLASHDATDRFNSTVANNAAQYNANAQNNMATFNTNNAMQQQQQGLAGLLGMDQRTFQGANAVNQLGQQQRGVDQQRAASAYEQFLRQQGYGREQQNDYVNQIRQLTFGNSNQGGSNVSPVASGLGAAMSIYGLLGNNKQQQGGWTANDQNNYLNMWGVGP